MTWVKTSALWAALLMAMVACTSNDSATDAAVQQMVDRTLIRELMDRFQSASVGLAQDTLTMEGPLLHRKQGAALVLDKIVQASDEARKRVEVEKNRKEKRK